MSTPTASTLKLAVLLLAALVSIPAAADLGEQKRPCSNQQIKAADAAFSEAKAALGKAIDSFKAPSASDINRQKRWFGVLNSESAKKIQANYERALLLSVFSQYWCPLSSVPQLAWFAGECGSRSQGRSGRHFPSTAFFSRPAVGADSRMGTLIHELSHLVGVGMRPEEYGFTKAKALALAVPNKARNNSDNYQYYVEDMIFGLP